MIITIAGDPGSGKSTLAKQLAARLKMKHYSGGDIFRSSAKKHGMTVEEFSKAAEEDPDLYDRKVDAYIKELGKKEDDFVIDGRLAFYTIPHSTKIYVTCDVTEAAKRLLGDKREGETWSSVEEGVQKITRRQESEKKRYMNLYGVDHTDTSQFDFVIDSTETTKEEKMQQALEFLKEHTKTL